MFVFVYFFILLSVQRKVALDSLKKKLIFLHSVISTEFSIRKVTLSLEPDTEVAWGVNVTLRCQAVLNKPVALSLEFTIYKGKNLVCTQNLSSSMDLLCSLTKVKQVNTGRYWCAVKFEDIQENSDAKRLMVKGVVAIMDTMLCIRLKVLVIVIICKDIVQVENN